MAYRTPERQLWAGGLRLRFFVCFLFSPSLCTSVEVTIKGGKLLNHHGVIEDVASYEA